MAAILLFLEKATTLTPWEQGSASQTWWLAPAPYSVSSIGPGSLDSETGFLVETRII